MKALTRAFLDELKGDEDAMRELAEALERCRPHRESSSDAPGSWTLDAKQKAAELGVHPDTLGKWVRAGRIPAVKVGREWRFRRGDLPKTRSHAENRAVVDVGTPRRRPSATASVAATVAAIRGR